MMDNDGGLVKRLLFPAFSDAGANDTFATATSTRTVDKKEGTTQSDATTAVHDNRSFGLNDHLRQAGDRRGRESPISFDRLPRCASEEANKSMQTETGSFKPAMESTGAMRRISESQSSRTARLFPSTDPSTNPSSKHHIASRGSRSPHTAGRTDRPKRKSSTSIMTGSASLYTRSMFLSATAAKNPSCESAKLVCVENAEQSSNLLTKSGSDVVNSVAGYNVVDQTSGHACENDEESTPVTSNSSNQYDTENEETSIVTKPLTLETLKEIDPQIERDTKESSDVNSNISEYGTVVEAPSRLADVQRLAAHMEELETKEDELVGTPMAHYKYQEAQEKRILPSPTSDELESVALTSDVVDLALPSLSSRQNDNDSNPPQAERALPSSPLRFTGVTKESPGEKSQNSGVGESIPSKKKSSIVSEAIRRFGSGVGTLSQSLKSPTSRRSSGASVPPSTPPTPLPDLQRSKSGDVFPSTFLLRSPGSALSRDENNTGKQSKTPISPRYRSLVSLQNGQSGAMASPLRIARGCFSFDTSLDEFYTEETTAAELRKPLSTLNNDDTPHISRIRCNNSWDVGSSVLAAPGQDDPWSTRDIKLSPGRTRASIKDNYSTFNKTSSGRKDRRFSNEEFDEDPPNSSTSSKDPNVAGLSHEIGDTIALGTPNRIEIEREDALGLLACLVERSAEFNRRDNSKAHCTPDEVPASQNMVAKNADDSRSQAQVSVCDHQQTGSRKPPIAIGELETTTYRSDSGSSDLNQAVQMLRAISQGYEQNLTERDRQKECIDHNARMGAIEELLRSHVYASEMKRATTSASAWLRSISRTENANSAVVPNSNAKARKKESGLFPSGHFMVDQTEVDERRKIEEQKQEIQKLNEELSLCRAEIGRLKSSTRGEVRFTSPNRSILDDNEENSVTSSEYHLSKIDGEVGSLEHLVDESSILETSADASGGYASFDTSLFRSDPGSTINRKEELDLRELVAESKQQVIVLKASIGRANDVIRSLHAKLKNGNAEGNGRITESAEDLVVNMGSPELAKELNEYKLALKQMYEPVDPLTEMNDSRSEAILNSPTDGGPCSPEKHTINVRMLDGENFSTEWRDLAPGLPPPPDHGLRSPIVRDLLDQWTSDESMQKALILWIDKVLDGEEPKNMQPLTVSGLNHVVRDGLTMHVLPLLLRRPDILVKVSTRAHRTTTYDMSIAVNSATSNSNDLDGNSRSSRSNLLPSQLAAKRQMMAFKASHSNAHFGEETGGRLQNYSRAGTCSRASENGSDSVAHSAVTEHITNSAKLQSVDQDVEPILGANKGYDLEGDSDHHAGLASASLIVDELSVGSSMSHGSQRSKEHQSGLMSIALGLISRRKVVSTPLSPLPSSSYDDEGWNNPGGARSHWSPRASAHDYDELPSFLRPPSSPGGNQTLRQMVGEDLPYHRVVSAPPGRIGVTFVQYRGHAVVSDVARESPLSGWVFPSDVLIAIDEVPVSGMRVRDIVHILTSRKDRQRALRVISKNAMDEALNASDINED